jgi:pimeloyl-ACP methyl ester carboxylesterase/DNA-binding winged helix-turn-helix (wHTH) protein
VSLRLRFSDYVLDTERRELWRGTQPVRVEPQVFDLLAFLVENRDRVVTKDDVFAAVWHGRIVSEATLSSRINAVRRAIGDTGEKQHLLRTVHRHGFRFVGEVASADVNARLSARVSESGNALEQKIRFCRSPDGTRLAIGNVGSGAALVKTANWLNHLEFDWESPVWSPFLRKLASHYRLVRYDARGNGLSDQQVDELSFDAFVTDLETVADAMDLKRFSLLGISQGASVAIAYAIRHPQRVEKLVLMGAYAQGRNKRGTPTDAEQARALLTLMRSGWGQEHSAFMQAFSSIYLPKGTPEQISWFTDLQRKTTSPENAIRIRLACDQIDVTELLAKVTVPTLVMHSRHDNVAPFDQGRLIASSIPGARLVSLESDNHVPLQGEPAWDRMVREVLSFLGT